LLAVGNRIFDFTLIQDAIVRSGDHAKGAIVVAAGIEMNSQREGQAKSPFSRARIEQQL
jgi:hypothetical protein